MHSRYFSLSEWPDPNVLSMVDAEVIKGLDSLRYRFGAPILPSKHPGGWARLDGSTDSQHYAKGRLATAADVFPVGPVLDCWLAAIEDPFWGGIGLYLDTRLSPSQPGAMLHLDIRSEPRIMWVRNEVGKYTYKHTEPDKFWGLVGRVPRHVFRG